LASQVAPLVKSPPTNAGDKDMCVRSLGWEDPLEEEMANNPVFLPEKFHAQRSLVGYSPWGHRVRHS